MSAGVLGSGTGKWKETEKLDSFPLARWKCGMKGAGEGRHVSGAAAAPDQDMGSSKTEGFAQDMENRTGGDG